MSGDNYHTDMWMYRGLFWDWWDPCPYDEHFEGAWDGLAADWAKHGGSRIFVNPPYSKTKDWVNKCLEEIKNDGIECIAMLLKHDSSTSSWSSLKEAGAQFLPVMGRMKHRTGAPAAFPQVLVVLYGGDE